MTALAEKDAFGPALGVVGEPIQLRPKAADAEDFPLETLPPRMSAAIRAIVEIAQVPTSLAAQSVLGATAIVAQTRINVQMPTREVVPCTLFLFSIATSGDRKSSCDRLALGPVYDREKELRVGYELLAQTYTFERAAYEASVKSAKSGTKKSKEDIQRDLEACGPPPMAPAIPLLLVEEPTIEGIVKLLDEAYPSLGLFSDDGAAFLGGYSMQDEQEARTGAMLSQLWDGKPIKRVRAGDVTKILDGRRCSLHLMVQPGVAAKLFGNKALRDQGLLSRMLVTSPKSLKGQRLWQEPTAASWAAVQAYRERLRGLLEVAFNRMDPQTRALDFSTVELTPEAREMWIAFSDGLERQQGPDGPLAEVSDIASKMAQHAVRMAACVSYFEMGDKVVSQGISGKAMAAGIALGEFYLSEALRLFNIASTDEISDQADAIIDFIRKEKLSLVGKRWLQRHGPQKHVGVARTYSLALDLLVEHGHLVKVTEPKTTFTAREEEHTERNVFTVIYSDDGGKR